MKPVISDNHNNQLLYFTTSSLSADDKKLFFISDRTGDVNIFARNLETGKDTQITQNSDGYLKSYVSFDGNPNKGLGKVTVSLDAKHETVYYVQGENICKADIDGNITVLNQIKNNETTAYSAISADGKFLCIPTTDSRALDYNKSDLSKDGYCFPNYEIDTRVREENLNSYLNIYDTQTGELVKRVIVERGWVTHVQFSPLDSSQILYNHEWTQTDQGTRRIWLYNGHDKTHTKLRTENNTENLSGWVCHEVYTADGAAIVYHGSYVSTGLHFVGKIDTDTLKTYEIAFDKLHTKYGHFVMRNDGLIVTDGYYQRPDDIIKRGKYIATLRPDWDAGTLTWQELCENKSDWDSQDSHPHPIFNHKGDKIYFTSNFEGKRGVYEVAAPIMLNQ